jgi:hypothetical protein
MLWQIGIRGSGGVDPTTIDINQVNLLIANIVNVLLTVIGVVVFIYIIVAGIQYITAGGNATKQTEAKRAITSAVIGLIIVMAAFAITQEVLQQLGFDANIGSNQDLGPLQQGIRN